MVESVDVSPTPLRYWYSFSPTKPGFPTDSEDGATVLKAYEKSLPMRSGPPFHGEYLLEAQEPSKGAPFSNTIIGRLPSEIREDIYISALTIDPVPDHLKYHYKPRAQQIWPAEWSRDHQPTTESSAQRRWPHDYEALSSLSPAFVATFPSRANPKVRSRLHLLLTCRQIYNEAWHLYYSINHFDFGHVSSMVHFASKVTSARWREVTSVSTYSWNPPPGERFTERALHYLVSRVNLRDLTLRLGWQGEPYFELLRDIRGLRRVNISVIWGHCPLPEEEKERIKKDVEELNQLLLRPKE